MPFPSTSISVQVYSSAFATKEMISFSLIIEKYRGEAYRSYLEIYEVRFRLSGTTFRVDL
jgi:hypothetical protein